MTLSHVTKICTRRKLLEQNVSIYTFKTPGGPCSCRRGPSLEASASPRGLWETGPGPAQPDPPQGHRCGGLGGSSSSPFCLLSVTRVYCGNNEEKEEDVLRSAQVGFVVIEPLSALSGLKVGQVALGPGSPVPAAAVISASFLPGFVSLLRAVSWLRVAFSEPPLLSQGPLLRGGHGWQALGALCPGRRPGPFVSPPTRCRVFPRSFRLVGG